MSTGGVAGVGVRPDQIVNQQEAQQHLAADGKTKLPDDAKAVEVKSGDTISDIMKEHGLDWNNKAQREQFKRLKRRLAKIERTTLAPLGS